MNKQKISGIHVGSSSILVTFVLLCLITFATLSLVTVKGNEKLGKDAGTKIQAYYEALGLANDICSQCDTFSNNIVGETGDLDDLANQLFNRLPGELAQYTAKNDIPARAITVTEDSDFLILSFELPYDNFILYTKVKIMPGKRCTLDIEAQYSAPAPTGKETPDITEDGHPNLLF